MWAMESTLAKKGAGWVNWKLVAIVDYCCIIAHWPLMRDFLVVEFSAAVGALQMCVNHYGRLSLGFFLWYPEVRVFSGADVFAAHSADG